MKDFPAIVINILLLSESGKQSGITLLTVCPSLFKIRLWFMEDMVVVLFHIAPSKFVLSISYDVEPELLVL